MNDQVNLRDQIINMIIRYRSLNIDGPSSLEIKEFSPRTEKSRVIELSFVDLVRMRYERSPFTRIDQTKLEKEATFIVNNEKQILSKAIFQWTSSFLRGRSMNGKLNADEFNNKIIELRLDYQYKKYCGILIPIISDQDCDLKVDWCEIVLSMLGIFNLGRSGEYTIVSQDNEILGIQKKINLPAFQQGEEDETDDEETGSL